MTTNPSPPDWRGLCEELLEALDGWHKAVFETGTGWVRPDETYLIDRARAALAAEADGPAVPEGREPASVVGEPSDEELLRIAAEAIDPYDKIGLGEYEAETECAVEAYGSELIAFARAVLARFGGRPAPAPAGEVGELVAWLRDRAESTSLAHNALRITRAADLLEQRHPAPVPVSERPWEREGWCHPEERWAWFYNRRVGWRDAIPPESLKPPTLFPYTHSLPFTALPLPAGEVQP